MTFTDLPRHARRPIWTFSAAISDLLLHPTPCTLHPEQRREMAQPSEWPKVIRWTYATAVPLYLSCGVLGYYAYGDAALANINANFPPNAANWVSIAVQCAQEVRGARGGCLAALPLPPSSPLPTPLHAPYTTSCSLSALHHPPPPIHSSSSSSSPTSSRCSRSSSPSASTPPRAARRRGARCRRGPAGWRCELLSSRRRCDLAAASTAFSLPL